jgi:hypothetical protein
MFDLKPTLHDADPTELGCHSSNKWLLEKGPSSTTGAFGLEIGSENDHLD